MKLRRDTMPMVQVRIPALRAQRHLSQRQLAALAGLRPDTVSALERGAAGGIRFETLARLCETLGCGPGDLLEVQAVSHEVPLLGGPDEDTVLRTRLTAGERRVDGPSFIQELLRSGGSGATDPGT